MRQRQMPLPNYHFPILFLHFPPKYRYLRRFKRDLDPIVDFLIFYECRMSGGHAGTSNAPRLLMDATYSQTRAG